MRRITVNGVTMLVSNDEQELDTCYHKYAKNFDNNVLSLNVPDVPSDALYTTCVVAGVDMGVIYTYEPPSYIDALERGWCGLVEIYTVEIDDIDLILVLNEETLQDIEDQLVRQHEEDLEPEYPD
ncbi:hypothetical protein UFOVP1043_77 [uncultured Caudovirales phage]|uniref:Uncharacterized protein n=1 Tax=uncultured Caudovirales phage TaxID=2100421 RepID=A0A6J5Q7B5_9CAUD|nr:hypothetical protein UFOVP1043_77 [uncultured Caudovirales phage]